MFESKFSICCLSYFTIYLTLIIQRMHILRILLLKQVNKTSFCTISIQFHDFLYKYQFCNHCHFQKTNRITPNSGPQFVGCTLWVVNLPFHRTCISAIYIIIHKTVAKLQLGSSNEIISWLEDHQNMRHFIKESQHWKDWEPQTHDIKELCILFRYR